jgi:hypothetical protein
MHLFPDSLQQILENLRGSKLGKRMQGVNVADPLTFLRVPTDWVNIRWLGLPLVHRSRRYPLWLHFQYPHSSWASPLLSYFQLYPAACGTHTSHSFQVRNFEEIPSAELFALRSKNRTWI